MRRVTAVSPKPDAWTGPLSALRRPGAAGDRAATLSLPAHGRRPVSPAGRSPRGELRSTPRPRARAAAAAAGADRGRVRSPAQLEGEIRKRPRPRPAAPPGHRQRQQLRILARRPRVALEPGRERVVVPLQPMIVSRAQAPMHRRLLAALHPTAGGLALHLRGGAVPPPPSGIVPPAEPPRDAPAVTSRNRATALRTPAGHR